MLPHIIPLDSLRPEDITLSARLMFDAGHDISDCPYPVESDAATRWRKAFIALDLQTEVV